MTRPLCKVLLEQKQKRIKQLLAIILHIHIHISTMVKYFQWHIHTKWPNEGKIGRKAGIQNLSIQIHELPGLGMWQNNL